MAEEQTVDNGSDNSLRIGRSLESVLNFLLELAAFREQ